MIVADPTSGDRGWRCIGFAEFCDLLDNEETFSRWFERLEASIDTLAASENCHSPRLIELNQQLADLIDFLDPQNVRFPLRQVERSQYCILPTDRKEGKA
jgi:hypothetical protein